jgi:hypothetical protein
MRAVNPVEHNAAQESAALSNLSTMSGDSQKEEDSRGRTKRTAGDPDARRMTP